jgi:hypothetical protein
MKPIINSIAIFLFVTMMTAGVFIATKSLNELTLILVFLQAIVTYEVVNEIKTLTKNK